MYSFPNLEPDLCSMSGSNSCFLTCIQVSHEHGLARQSKVGVTDLGIKGQGGGPLLMWPCLVTSASVITGGVSLSEQLKVVSASPSTEKVDSAELSSPEFLALLELTAFSFLFVSTDPFVLN